MIPFEIFENQPPDSGLGTNLYTTADKLNYNFSLIDSTFLTTASYSVSLSNIYATFSNYALVGHTHSVSEITGLTSSFVSISNYVTDISNLNQTITNLNNTVSENNIVKPQFIDSYRGTRIAPISSTYSGFTVVANSNSNIGFNVVNTNTGNGAIAAIGVSGTSSTGYGLGFQYCSPNYFVPYLRDNNIIFSFNDLFINTSSGKSIDFRTGTNYGDETSKFKINNNGQLQIGSTPSTGSTNDSLLVRDSSGNLKQVNSASYSLSVYGATNSLPKFGTNTSFTQSGYFDNGSLGAGWINPANSGQRMTIWQNSSEMWKIDRGQTNVSIQLGNTFPSWMYSSNIDGFANWSVGDYMVYAGTTAGNGIERLRVKSSNGDIVIGTTPSNGLATDSILILDSTNTIKKINGASFSILGVTGSTGATGSQGIQGATGFNGTSGTSGSSGTSGISGATGSDGTSGTSGSSGTSGLTGATGATGAAGFGGTSSFYLTGTTQSAYNATSSIYRTGAILIGTASLGSTADRLIVSNGATVSLAVDTAGNVYNRAHGVNNTVYGYQALGSMGNNGSFNTSIGYQALTVATNSNNNTAIGHLSMWSTTSGQSNTAIGVNTLRNNNSGGYNVAIGVNSMFTNSSGGNNVAVGQQSLYSNTNGSQNTALGFNTLYGNTSGGNNTGVGFGALASNSTGSSNVAIGENSLSRLVEGYSNVAIGSRSLYLLENGSNNTAIGYQALSLGTSSNNNNTAVGYQTLMSNTNGNYNTAVGMQSLLLNTTGYENTAIGNFSLVSNTTGIQNTALGANSLYNNTTGNYNTSIGIMSLVANTTGGNNVALGAHTLYSNTIGVANNSIGYQSLYNNTIGSYNSAIGLYSLFSNTTGNYNTSLGNLSLYSNTTGSYTVALGYLAGSSFINNNSIFIGYNSQANNNNQTNQIVIGSEAIGNGSNTVVIGNNSILSTQLKGSVGIGTSNPTSTLHIVGAVTIQDGSEGAGKVLTSDADGVASWEYVTGGGGSSTQLPVPKVKLVQDKAKKIKYIIKEEGQSADVVNDDVEDVMNLHGYPIVIPHDFTVSELESGNIFLELVHYRRTTRKKTGNNSSGYVTAGVRFDTWDLPWSSTNSIRNNVSAFGAGGINLLAERKNFLPVTSLYEVIPAYETLHNRFHKDIVGWNSASSPGDAGEFEMIIPSVGYNRGGSNTPTKKYPYSSFITPYYIAFRYIKYVPETGTFISGPMSNVIKIMNKIHPFIKIPDATYGYVASINTHYSEKEFKCWVVDKP